MSNDSQSPRMPFLMEGLGPEMPEPALGLVEVNETADIIVGVVEGFEETDAMLFLLPF
jgi:hypothetical protein